MCLTTIRRHHVPTLIIRGGEKDYDHPTGTSREVHASSRVARLIEPPWPEDAWEKAALASPRGPGIFDFWQLGAPGPARVLRQLSIHDR